METKNQARQRRMNRKHTAVLLASGLILLGATFNVHCMEFNSAVKFWQAKKFGDISLLIEEEPSKSLLESSFENFDSLPEQVVVEFENACKTPVTDALIKLIHKNKRNSPENWQIVVDTYEDPKKGSMDNVCVYNEHTMYINPDNLKSYVGYLNGSIVKIPETMGAVLVHESIHIYHDLIGENRAGKQEIIESFRTPTNGNIIDLQKEAWHDDEEIRTETGKFLKGGKLQFDVINANTHLIFEGLQQGKSFYEIPQRMLHYTYFDAPKEYLYGIENFIIKPDEITFAKIEK